MKYRAIALGLGLAVSNLADPLAHAQDRRFTILHTNDMHGRHTAFPVAPGDATAQTGDPGRAPAEFSRAGDIGGFAHLAGAIRDARARAGADRVLLVDGGDTFSDDLVGNATRGEAMIRLMNAVGYQFMALGNHDFDYGLERTRELQALADFPMRGANTLLEGGPLFGRPWEVFEVGGVRVAILALSYHNTGETGSKGNTRALTFTNGIETTRALLPQLQAAADVIVVLSHQGTAVDREMARQLPQLDLIVGAHSHDRIAPPEQVAGVWIAQALSDDAALGELTIDVDADGSVTHIDGRLIDLWTDEIAPDPAIAALVAEIDAPHRARLDEVLAVAYDRIGRQYKSESPFDVLVGDLMREHTGADIAFMPGVGYGVSITPGPVTRERLYTLLPHPTKLVTLDMTGAQVLEVLEQSATNLEPGDVFDRVGGLIQTSGLSWTFDLNAPVGSRVSQVTVGGAVLEPSTAYAIATNVGLFEGLHRYQAFASGQNAVTHDISVTQLVEDGIRHRGILTAPVAGHIRRVAPIASAVVEP